MPNSSVTTLTWINPAARKAGKLAACPGTWTAGMRPWQIRSPILQINDVERLSQIDQSRRYH
jgi:hypothetical protein